MTVVTGQRNTTNQASVQRYVDITNPIRELEPDATPLTQITRSLGSRPTGDKEYHWTESEREVTSDAINKSGGYEASVEEMVVDTEEVFAANQLVIAPRTNEIMIVKELKGSSKVKFLRGQCGTSAAALNDNEPLFVIARAAEEGTTSFEARTGNPTKITNYTEIFKTSVSISGTAGSSRNQTTPHDWDFQKKQKMREHKIAMERAFLFGHKSIGTGPGGKPMTTLGGVLSFYTENNQDAGGTLTETELATWIRALTRFGSDMKTVFCSRLVLDVINAYAVGRLQTIQSDRDTVSGVSTQEYITANGTLKLVPHKLLEGAVWGGYAIAIDFKQARPEYRPLGGGPLGSRDTALLTNRQATDMDGLQDEVRTEAGVTWPEPKTGGVLTGVTG